MLQNSPSIVTDGLVLYYDMNNPKSFTGSPTINQIGLTDGYPTIGNNWGTYNTNNYGSGTFFSIGTISSVSGNIVTTSGNHGLRTYDVMRPQTSGGGLVANTDYFIKAWSATTFSVYTYNSSQDGSQGFATLDNINTDNRLSINSTSFPTMWWGYPHLPNSGIIKQVITNGFRYKGRIHDCLRVHWHRPDGVKDGMAYGVYPSWIVGNNTVTFYYRASDPRGVGASVAFSIWCNGYSVGAPAFTLSSEWQKFTFTTSSTQAAGCNFYWFANSGPTRFSWDIAEITSNQSAITTEMVSGTRSTTQSVLDLTGNRTFTVNSLNYNSDGTFNFTGANNIDLGISVYSLGIRRNATFGGWFKPTDTGSVYVLSDWNGVGMTLRANNTTSTDFYVYGNNHRVTVSYTFNIGQWYNLVGVMDGDNMYTYINGILAGSTTLAEDIGSSPSTLKTGTRGDGGAGTGYVSSAYVYNRTLSAAEVRQNFNALRGRHGV